MALSVSSMRPISSVSTVAVKPMNYSVENQSEVSDVYNAMATTPTQGIDSVSPVMYPNAQAQATSPVAQAEAAVKADKAFNDIASSFAGSSTGYDSAMAANSYSMVGANIDLLA